MSEVYKTSIVAKGLWNPRIFNPQWLKKILLPIFPGEQELKLEVSLNLIELVAAYKYYGVSIMPTYEVLKIETEDLSAIEKVSQVFTSIMDALPQTPISGVGYNFNCRFDSATSNFGKSILADKNNCKVPDFSPANYKSTSNPDFLLNLIVLKTENQAEVDVELNYHYDVVHLDDAWQKVKGRLYLKHFADVQELIK